MRARRYNGRVIDPNAIAAVLADLREPQYRTRQVYQALTRGLVTDFHEITTLPLRLRSALADRLCPVTLTPVDSVGDARDAVEKTLFAAADGAPVEAVLMTYPKRATVCVSTQVGCAVGCAFCASGRLGLRRDLKAEEMVDQVLHFARLLRERARVVSNVVFMGMGEPFHNYDETLRACRLLNDPDGFDLGARSMAVSTAGVVPGIDRLAREPLQVHLAVSLHAGTDELRDRLVPLNRTYPLDEVFAACARYVRSTHRKVLYEYVVMDGVNDTDEQAQALAPRVRGPYAHLNLIAYNETGGEFRRPQAARLAAFKERLEAAGVDVTLRRSPGAAIDAACGQLALRSAAPQG